MPDSPKAPPALDRLAHAVPPELRQGMEILLSRAADPASAVRRLDSFFQQNPAEFQEITWMPFGLQALVALFSTSQFLSEEVLQHPGWLLSSLQSGLLHRPHTPAELAAELESFLALDPNAPPALRLASFRRKQLMRILLRDVLGFAALSETTAELSHLADAIVEGAYHLTRLALEQRFGVPRLAANGRVCGFSVLALGKLGGIELNYSSDIDLIFLYEGAGSTDGPSPLSNAEFFKKLAVQLTALLGTYTSEGVAYRVDLRLRPDGRLGELCVSLEAARDYYSRRARDWELQMLIKARAAAGEAEPAATFLEWVQPRIYSTTTDFRAIEAMTETRERIGEKVARRRPNRGLDVKLAPGGIRDIEFLVQCLQRMHGGREAWLRNSSTLLALVRLRDKDLLSDSEYGRLSSAYQFLRHLEHRLQVVEDRQTHTLPDKLEDLALLARRMPSGLLGEDPSPENLLARLHQHLDNVQRIYARVIHAQRLPEPPAAPPARPPREGVSAQPAEETLEVPASNLVRFLEQQAPAFAANVLHARFGRTRAAFEHFLEEALKHPNWIQELEADPTLASHLIDLFTHSPYFAEQLVRHPEYFEELRGIRTRGLSATPYGEIFSLLDQTAEIRRYFLQQLFRLEAESICLQSPVFHTLQRTTALADGVIASVYRVAREEVLAQHSPSSRSYAPDQQMMVVALGRLGMLEFDLGSDADLVFVLPDADLAELPFWTRVAERLITLLGAYTGDGTIFAVDTRLRPNGQSGALVQSESAVKEYFATSAQTWEGLAYMKSRAVAGDTRRATAFLEELQRIDWRRHGQAGRSRAELRDMRTRIEKEQGDANPLKNAPGGYYDVDFALTYLRLRGAGMFFPALNTPARIDVLEQMGHLEPGDARFLLDAATFYRSVDHGLRLIVGHTEGNLPRSEAQLGILNNLIRRWVPPHLCDQPLAEELRQIQERTRVVFDRIFS